MGISSVALTLRVTSPISPDPVVPCITHVRPGSWSDRRGKGHITRSVMATGASSAQLASDLHQLTTRFPNSPRDSEGNFTQRGALLDQTGHVEVAEAASSRHAPRDEPDSVAPCFTQVGLVQSVADGTGGHITRSVMATSRPVSVRRQASWAKNSPARHRPDARSARPAR